MTPYAFGGTGTALLWPYPHNWQSPASERLEWKTWIHRSQSGAEQRTALRAEPRLAMGFNHLLTDHRAGHMLRQNRGLHWAVPAWWAASTLTAAAGDTLALSRPTDTLWPAGGWALLWRSADDFELAEIDSISTDSLLLTAAVSGDWPAGSLVLPLHECVLESVSDMAPTDGVHVLQCSWRVVPGSGTVLEEPATGTDWATTFPTGTSAADPRAHLLVGGSLHNWREQLSLAYEADVEEWDAGGNFTSRRLASDLPRATWSVSRLLRGTEIAQLRNFLAAHRGSAVGFYATNPTADLEVLSLVGDTLTVTELGEEFPGVLLGAQAFAATLWDADTVQLDGDLTGVDTSNPRLVSAVRLAADAVEITHHTAGVAEVLLPIMTTVAPAATALPTLLLHFDGNLTDAVSGEVFTGATPTWVTGVFSQAMQGAGGSTGAVSGAWTTSFSLAGEPFTFEFRVYRTGTQGGIVASKNYWPSEPSSGNFRLDWAVSIDGNNGQISFSWSNLANANSPLSVSSDTGLIGTGAWHAVAITDDGALMRFYIDGLLVRSVTSPNLHSTYPLDSSGGQVALFGALSGFRGSDPNWGGGTFNGMMLDEFRLTIGRARYTGASYTVATEPFTA